MPIHQTLRGAHVPVHIFTDDIDAQALRQLHNIASLPIVHPHVAAMPDVHAGIGATVGSSAEDSCRLHRPSYDGGARWTGPGSPDDEA